MNTARVEYVVDLDGLADLQVASACRSALELVAGSMGHAETDIPWGVRDTWPREVQEAALRLSDGYVRESGDRTDYMQTGVLSLTDAHVRDDCILLAPYAYDATFWDPDLHELASLADEGTSFVIWLTDTEREVLGGVIGAERLIRLVDWNRAHPSLWRRWLRSITSRRGPASE